MVREKFDISEDQKPRIKRLFEKDKSFIALGEGKHNNEYWMKGSICYELYVGHSIHQLVIHGDEGVDLGRKYTSLMNKLKRTE